MKFWRKRLKNFWEFARMGKDLWALHNPVNWHHIRQGKKRELESRSLWANLCFSLLCQSTQFLTSPLFPPWDLMVLEMSRFYPFWDREHTACVLFSLPQPLAEWLSSVCEWPSCFDGLNIILGFWLILHKSCWPSLRGPSLLLLVHFSSICSVLVFFSCSAHSHWGVNGLSPECIGHQLL